MLEGDKLRGFIGSGGNAVCEIRLDFASELPEPKSGSNARYCRYSSGSERPDVPYAYIEQTETGYRLIALEEHRARLSAEDVLRLVEFNHVLLENDAVVLHGSYIATPEGAIVFSAPCGTGKSTQAQLWKEYRGARIINGDRCLIRCQGEVFTVGGIYYSGTSEFCENVTSPLRAVVLLEQAKENRVSAAKGADAFMKLLRQCAYKNDIPTDPVKAVELMHRLVSTVPVLSLACLPDESAVEALEKAL